MAAADTRRATATPGITAPIWPADAVERRPVASLVPYARNARTHSDAQVAQIAASIREWGWTVPVLVDEAGGIIAGHGRVMAAVQLGLADVPTMTARGWSDAQKKAYVLADNRISENSTWDIALVSTELDALGDIGFDLSLTGFDTTELTSVSLLDVPAAKAYETSPVTDTFWISIKGPLKDQASVLSRMKAAMADLGLVTVDLGTTQGA